jgi:hypothetical protein
MIVLKKGVRLHGLGTEILVALISANDAYASRGKDCVITSAIDGRHSRSSKHYTGCAVDLRIRHLPEKAAESIVQELKTALGDDFDVVLEKDHIHLEYDPKEPY